MITKTRNHRLFKVFVSFVVLNFVLQTIQPSFLLASNGGGAAQPEFNAFTPIESQDLVNLFTGDFKYNIPLLDVGGYPLNLSYNGDIKMDQEASWVGLGWNINVGAITRDLRGIPDEFNGDRIEEKFNMKPNVTIGANAGLGAEVFGLDPIRVSYGSTISWNNYDGISMAKTVSPSFRMFQSASSSKTVDLGLSITSDDNGLSLSPSISFNSKTKDSKDKDVNMGLSIGTTFNSRKGLNTISVTSHYSDQTIKNTANLEMGSASTSFDLVNNTYVPSIDFPRHNFSIDANFKLGADFFGADATGNIGGFYSQQKLATKSLSTAAYGYLFSDVGANYSSALMDVNLSKDRSFVLNQTNLAVPNFTYDIYQITGQGIGGSFRPMRNDMGFLKDKYTSSTSDGVSLGFELGTGGLVHGGFDYTVSTNYSHSGHWQAFNEATNKIKFKSKEVNSPYETYLFKMSDEISPDLEMSDENFASLHSQIGKEYPTQVVLAAVGGFDVKTTSNLHPKGQGITEPISPLSRNENIRAKRNKNISVLSKEEKSKYGITRSVSSHAKDYHPAEFTVLNSDGRRYVYGEAVYNTLKKDVSFNVSGRNNDCEKSRTSYSIDNDNSENNKRGKDHYFNAQTLPPYAHSHLLTAVLSSDYVDSDNSGSPSPTDLGDYVFFKYGQTISDFKWRVPYTQANFNQGLKTKNDDDRASYIYGEKEVKYLTEIESKNYIARFYFSKREDGLPVKGENGGQDDEATPLRKLDSIELYSRAEIEQNMSNPKPIKKVHFRYSYDLCKNNPSSVRSGGKLTLERVYFTYGFSSKGALSDYEFTYGTGDYNPTYERSFYNVWGGYQKYSAPSCNPDSNGDMPSFEFPFVRQEKFYQDMYAAAWALKSIKTPEGGKIEIDLEADDYAKVQDKDAMQMFKIIAAGSSPSFPEGTEDFLYFPPNNNAPNTYLFFQLPEGFTNEAVLKQKYFKNLMDGELLYFRFLVDLTAVGDYEYVEGFVEVEDVSINGNYGVIEIKKICKNKQNTSSCNNSNKVNPISFAAWNFGLANHPELVNGYAGTIDLPGDNPNEDQMKRVLTQLTNPSLIRNITEFLSGKYTVLRTKGYASRFVPNKSWVRLYNPDRKMLGGGSRVKNIRIYDNWGAMTDAPNGYDGTTVYEQHYDYTLDNGTSSGVASYMPIGCRENPHVQPVFFSEKHVLAPDDKHFMLRPFGESFFPSPSIGYSKVTVSKSSYSNGQRRAATGKAVHEFYTTKDYPTKTDETRLNAIPKKTGLLGKLLKLNVKSNMFTSQGYSIITSDMNGKPKSVRVYGHNQTDYISGVDYIYENDISSSGNFGLKNKYPVVLQNGMIKSMPLGVDQDMFTYFSESESYGAIQGVQNNLATFIMGIIPAAVPTFFPSFQQQTTQYKTAITTKHIHKRGILKKTIQYDLGASIETENLAWDGETGEVLLTRIINEYGDYYYNLAHPAHWQYEDGMGAAFQNIALELNISTGADGAINVITPSVSHLVAGDELYFTDEIDKKYWVIENEIDDEIKRYIVDKDGIPYSNHSGVAKIIRSGRRNQHIASIGSIQSKINPIDTNNDGVLEDSLSIFLDNDFDQEVLQAEAIEYSDRWQKTYGLTKKIKKEDTERNCSLTPFGRYIWQMINRLVTL